MTPTTPQNEQPIRRVAMWSGPRNISTAMMRAWENRPDTVVHDEPLYAHYLHATGIDHPGRDEVITAYETDWRVVVAQLTGHVPDGKTIYYQKHMTHHLLDHMEWGWVLSLTNCFLIREPGRVIGSLAKVLPTPTIEQTGIPQQAALFRYVCEHTGETPPVIDARDVLKNPRRVLARLCERLDVPFTDAMLSWRAGSRATDGVWAKHWYASVEQSTGFMPYQPESRPVPAHLRHMLKTCDALYEELAAHRLN